MNSIIDLLRAIIEQLEIPIYLVATMAQIPADRFGTILSGDVNDITEEEMDAIISIISILGTVDYGLYNN